MNKKISLYRLCEISQNQDNIKTETPMGYNRGAMLWQSLRLI